MQATLEEIYQDPTILGRAIESGELLEIVNGGELKARVTPAKRKEEPTRQTKGPLPDFAKRRAEMGMQRLPPDLEAEFFRTIRGE